MGGHQNYARLGVLRVTRDAGEPKSDARQGGVKVGVKIDQAEHDQVGGVRAHVDVVRRVVNLLAAAIENGKPHGPTVGAMGEEVPKLGERQFSDLLPLPEVKLEKTEEKDNTGM